MEPEACAIATGLLDVPVSSASRIGGSGNNRVYSLQGEHAQKYVAKFYFRHPSDPRDRLETEFSGFSFLWAQGITNIPRPVAIDPKESCAIYEFIEGEKILPASITMEDIKSAVDFVRNLKDLNNIALSHHISPASDANFSVQATIANFQGRLDRLAGLKGEGKEYQELEAFFENDFRPFVGILLGWARAECASKGISLDAQIPADQRTLSPSDFGFHNAIRARDGRIIFLDFEYFGWDDPAKMIVDFLLHPAMALSESMKEFFVRGALDVFKENKGLMDRIRVTYPLHGLKWCMIFLNEFVPNDFSRRSFAAAGPLDASQVRRLQLLKAQNLFNKIQDTFQDFPYVPRS